MPQLLRISLLFSLLIPELAKSQSKIQEYIEEVSKLKSFSGSVLVARGDSILLNRGFGYADYENKVKNTDKTVHRIASLTKQFTSMGVLKLLDDSISLNEPVINLIPEFPVAWKNVTIHHLLTHTSGVPNLFGDLAAVPVEDTFEEINRVLKHNPDLESEPGSTYQYNNFGYVLLGRLIEVISQQDFFSYIRDEILVPLGMENTYYDDPRLIINNRSQGYIIKNGHIQNDALKDPAAFSAGGILSTTSDLLKFSKALKSDVILTSEQRASMFRPFLNNYALGWQVAEKNDRKMYNHNGGTHGFNSRMVYYPTEDIFIVVLGNNENVRSAALTCDIEGIIFKDESHKFSFPYKVEPQKLLELEGVYNQEESEETRELKVKNNKIYLVRGGREFELTPISENSFCFSNYEDIRLKMVSNNEFVISSCSVNPVRFLKKN